MRLSLDQNQNTNCSMCGKKIHDPAVIIYEEVNGSNFAFDSKVCFTTFKKFISLYGSDFLRRFQWEFCSRWNFWGNARISELLRI